MALVEGAGLVWAGLGGQGCPEEVPLGPEGLPEPGEEGGVGLHQGAGQVLKVHIQAGEALLRHGPLDLPQEPGLGGGVRQQLLRPLDVEPLLLRIGGEVHHGSRPVGPGPRQELPVPEGEEPQVPADAVGEGCQVAEERRGPRQEGRGEEGVGVAVGHGGAQLLLVIGDDQDLPRGQQAAAQELRVVPPERTDADAVAPGNGAQGLPGADGVDHIGEAEHQGLSHGQSPVRRDAVVRHQAAGVHAVVPGDGVDRLAGAHLIPGIHLAHS